MYKERLLYTCCHEAGHSVIRVLLGHDVLGVNASNCGGCVEYPSADWNCDCGGRLLADDTNNVNFNFNPQCANCSRFVALWLSAIYAGLAATQLVMPHRHEEVSAAHDYHAAAELSQSYCAHPEVWCRIESAGRQLACNLVKRERKAVEALTGALLKANGYLSGPEVIAVLTPALTSMTIEQPEI